MTKGKKLWQNPLVRRFCVALLAALLLGWAWFQRDALRMSRNYALTSTASVHFGTENQYLLIDQGKVGLEILDGVQTLSSHMVGGTLNKFFYAERVATGPDGTLYIADRAYRTAEDGSTETLERILELRGRECRVVWEAMPDAEDEFKAQTSSLCDLQYSGGKVWFLRDESSSLALYSFVPGGEVSLVRRVYVRDTINDASYDASSGILFSAARRGSVRFLPDGETTWHTVETEAEHVMPKAVTARGGTAYYSDAYSNQICRFRFDRPQDGVDVFYQSDVQIIEIEASEDGSQVLGSDGAGFFLLTEDGGTYIDTLTYDRFSATVLARVALGLAVLLLLWILYPILPLFGKLMQAESSLRVILVVLASISVTGFVACSLMLELFTQEDETLIDNMKLFAEVLRSNIDTDALKEVCWEKDYGGSAYLKVRAPLDQYLRLSYAENNYYYYILYRLDGDTMRLIMNADDYVMVGEPYEMGDQDYSAEVQRTGRSYSLRTRDADGDWINVMVPVTDSTGVRIAVLETGMDMGLRAQQRRATTLSMVLSVGCTTAVVVMLILEGLFLLSFLERKRKHLAGGETLHGPDLAPVRTLMCFSYIADSMQEPFIAVLCTQLYQGGLPLPDGVAAALPLSGQLLVMAVFSALAGPLSEKLGSRKLMTAGMAAQLLGSLCCFLLGSYYGILAGKLLIGAGMGTVYVSCNAVAAAARTEESAAAAFAGISAGTLSGMSIGAGLASLFLTIGGWRSIYLVGAILLAAALVLAARAGDVRPGAQTEQPEVPELSDSGAQTQSMGFFRFFFNRSVGGFFLLMLVPFMMSLSYREYFFPIFAQDHGLDEVRVGQIYLLCGLLVLYFGPPLTAWMLRTIGSLWSVVAASVLMGVNMLIFVLHPSMASVLLGVALVYAVFSFSIGCQYTYFQSTPECAAFGEGTAMGIYSVFESLGQTLGPISYGALLGLGQRPGIGIFCVAMLALTTLFTVLMWNRRKLYGSVA